MPLVMITMNGFPFSNLYAYGATLWGRSVHRSSAEKARGSPELPFSKCTSRKFEFIGSLAAFTASTTYSEIVSKLIKLTRARKIFESTGFSNLEEMKENLSSGIIGRVLVDRNTAFHFLDKSGLKRNRQIRLIRYIDYPMYYYLAHVRKEVIPTSSMSQNKTELRNVTQTAQRREQLAECGSILKESSTALVGESKETARNQLIPAELQVR